MSGQTILEKLCKEFIRADDLPWGLKYFITCYESAGGLCAEVWMPNFERKYVQELLRGRSARRAMTAAKEFCQGLVKDLAVRARFITEDEGKENQCTVEDTTINLQSPTSKTRISFKSQSGTAVNGCDGRSVTKKNPLVFATTRADRVAAIVCTTSTPTAGRKHAFNDKKCKAEVVSLGRQEDLESGNITTSWEAEVITLERDLDDECMETNNDASLFHNSRQATPGGKDLCRELPTEIISSDWTKRHQDTLDVCSGGLETQDNAEASTYRQSVLRRSTVPAGKDYSVSTTNPLSCLQDHNFGTSVSRVSVTSAGASTKVSGLYLAGHYGDSLFMNQYKQTGSCPHGFCSLDQHVQMTTTLALWMRLPTSWIPPLVLTTASTAKTQNAVFTVGLHINIVTSLPDIKVNTMGCPDLHEHSALMQRTNSVSQRQPSDLGECCQSFLPESAEFTTVPHTGDDDKQEIKKEKGFFRRIRRLFSRLFVCGDKKRMLNDDQIFV